MKAQSTVKYSAASSWKALTYYNLYRFLIAFLFVALYWIGQLPEPLGKYNQNIFAITSHVFLLVSLSAQFLIRLRKPSFVYQVTGQILVDILLISAFIYSSAGLNSGFGMLMVIAIAGGSILIPGRIGFFFAAVATLTVLGHEVYFQLAIDSSFPNYIHAGFLGATYFVTAFIGHALARKVEVSEALAEERAVDLANLSKLNEHIVQRLQSGIIVLDDKLNVRLANESASSLLGVKINYGIHALDKTYPDLIAPVRAWEEGTGASTFVIKTGTTAVEVQASLVRLSMENKSETLIFLDDVSKMRQQAQQLKLASLGRLTASIAHEVRNPLGAISHAAQLLNESEILVEEDKRLTAIITEQSVRVNNIIENVLKISRRERSVPAVIDLIDWLKNYIMELKTKLSLEDKDINLSSAGSGIYANMDPDQLYQIMWNLCENGIRYSRHSPLLDIRCKMNHDSGRPYIEIIDSGSGIDRNILDRLFEPFTTTETKGTGLGLFVARELCEANQASLHLYSNTENGCIFRIIFSRPDRRQVIT